MVSGETARGELGERLRELRAQSGKSLKQLEREVHASDSSLSRYLAGTTVPPWPVVEKLCLAADEDPAELRSVWQRASGETRGQEDAAPAPDPAPARERWHRRRPGWFVASVVAATAIVFGGAGLITGATVFPRVVPDTAVSQDKACADWSWPTGPGQQVEAPAEPSATDHQPVVGLEQEMVGGVPMVFAHLTGAVYGDRIWLDMTTDDGATWTQCGPFLVTGNSAVTRAHPLAPGLKFRGCADVAHWRPGTPRNSCTDFW